MATKFDDIKINKKDKEEKNSNKENSKNQNGNENNEKINENATIEINDINNKSIELKNSDYLNMIDKEDNDTVPIELKNIIDNYELIRSKVSKTLNTELFNCIEQFKKLYKKKMNIEKIKKLNSIINKSYNYVKNSKKLDKEITNLMNEIIRSMHKLNNDNNLNVRVIKRYDNGIYEGEFKNGKKEGYGIYKYNTGDIYEGEFKNDLKDGKGKYLYSNKEVYEGDFKEDHFEGKGVYIYNGGDKYSGEYKKDKRDGKGVYLYSNGNKYEGECKNGKKHGKGIY